MKRPKKRTALLLLACLLLCGIPFCWWQNNGLTTTRLDYENEKIPAAFDGYRIVQISDLHNKTFGENQKALLNQVAQLKPDAIFLTGDLIDSHRTNLADAMAFVTGAVELAPVYYVTGNHENYSGVLSEFLPQLEDAGVVLLQDESLLLERDGAQIALFGAMDPGSVKAADGAVEKPAPLPDRLNALSEEYTDYFRILLSHRPEYFASYAAAGFDLVFSGHAHGGQWRMPFLGGLYAPGQGILPQYTSGFYSEGETTMVVSRGLGNSVFPLRLFNRPEILAVTLRSLS